MATPVKPPNPEQIREGVGWLTVWWGAVCAFAGALVGVVAKLTKGVWTAAKYNGRHEWKDTYALTRAEHSAEDALQWERFERKNDQKFNDMQKAQYLDFKELKRDIEVAAEHSRSVDEQLKMLREMLMTIMQQKQ
jgi:hypothetical protein